VIIGCALVAHGSPIQHMGGMLDWFVLKLIKLGKIKGVAGFK
jgi:hypothetical protein